MIAFRIIAIVTILALGSMVGYYYLSDEGGTVRSGGEEFSVDNFVILKIDYDDFHMERSSETHNITEEYVNTTIFYKNGTVYNYLNTSKKAELSEDTHVFYILKLVAKIEYDDYGWGVYIKEINGLHENQDGNSHFWFYYVNGKQPPVGANKYFLSNDDVVEWNYEKWG